MRFCIVDDDPTLVQMLSNIIEDKELGQVVGKATDGLEGIETIRATTPDIVLMDYLMPHRDGVAVQRDIRPQMPQIKFVMISQVTDKAMVGDAYQAGCEFFITKPINVIEVERVLRSVSEKIEMERTLGRIRGMLSAETKVAVKESASPISRVRMILSHLGLVGEKGSYDIIEICEYLFLYGIRYPIDINPICEAMGENPKIVKQRIRRAVYHGLTNLASVGIEDYMNDHFQRYAGRLYDFESVRAEMDVIRGKRQEGGRVSVSKFLEGILILSELED